MNINRETVSQEVMIGFTTHLSPTRHSVDVTPTAAQPGSGGSLVKTTYACTLLTVCVLPVLINNL